MTDQFDASVDSRYGRVETATTPSTVHYINESGLPDDVIRNDRKLWADVASQVEQWSQSLSPVQPTRSIDVFARTKWSGANHPFAIMSMCGWAVENDDTLGTLADVAEGLTFKKMRFELNDDDQQDMWNQWAREVNLDARLREQFRDLYKFSQVYVGLWWDHQIYRVRDNVVSAAVKAAQAAQLTQSQIGPDGVPTGPPVPGAPVDTSPTGPGRGNRRRKKQFAVEIPTAMTVFDPTKILPVGTLMFGRERFAYIADEAENDAFGAALRGDVVDSTVMQLIERKYDMPNALDMKLCGELGVDPTRLWLMKEGAVYRHTLTRAQYERFAACRLKPALELLDMKKHLRSSDRSSLVGNTNFIVVITKGTDKLPAKQAEVDNLRQQASVVARLPVLVGDHRLHVEIVAPKIDNTLGAERWHVLDSRLVFIALRSFQAADMSNSRSAGSGASEMSRVVAQGLENRRHMLVRALEEYVFAETLRRNPGVLSEDPNLAFAPKRITLDFSADIINGILKLRDRGDISRETTLDELDFDQDVEVVRRANERAFYDQVFNSSTPFSSPQANPYNQGGQPTSGATPTNQQFPAPANTMPEGGRPAGGGQPDGDGG